MESTDIPSLHLVKLNTKEIKEMLHWSSLNTCVLFLLLTKMFNMMFWGVRYHEPEHWKFGEQGNQYFRHATEQIYAISKHLATYISTNQHMLHKYANEDVSLGSWFIGLNVQHMDDRRFCCATLPDFEWKAQAGNACIGFFDWSCSGICNSAQRMKEIHRQCGEGDNTLWNSFFS